MNDMTEMPAPLIFTDSAAAKVKSLTRPFIRSMVDFRPSAYSIR